MSSRLKKIYTFIALLMCFTLVFSSVNIAYASVLVKDYFRHIEQYSGGYNEYFFAINQSPYNDSFSDKSTYCSFYEVDGVRVGVLYNGSSYSIKSQSGTIIAYSKELYLKKDGSVGGAYDVLGGSYSSVSLSGGYSVEILYTSLYVFSDVNELNEYLQTGDTEGAIASPTMEYDSDNIYLNDFRVIYHDSNILDSCYIEVKYNIPDYLNENINKASLNVGINYNCQIEALAGAIDIDSGPFDVNLVKIYDLSLYPNGFNLYLSEISSGSNIQEQMMLGDELYIDFDSLSIDGFGANTIGQVTKSMLYLNLSPVIDNFAGLQYDAQVDLLNPSNTTFHSSTPDQDGNYTTNNDYTQGDGYYTTIVGTDGQGNPTYNYYYYDNSTHTTITLDPSFDTDTDVDVGVGGDSIPEGSDVLTILWGNALTVNGSLGGSGSGGTGGSGGDVTINGSGDNIDITIEDDDYTDASLREDLRDGFGLLDNMQTDESSDGFLQLSAKFYEHLDGELDDMLVFGMASVIVISILRSALRR